MIKRKEKFEERLESLRDSSATTKDLQNVLKLANTYDDVEKVAAILWAGDYGFKTKRELYDCMVLILIEEALKEGGRKI